MKWTKVHARNAVLARNRRHMAAIRQVEIEQVGGVAAPRRRRARFTLQIRDNLQGDSLTLNLHPSPWPHRWVCEHGEFSAAKIAKIIRLILGGGKAC